MGPLITKENVIPWKKRAKRRHPPGGVDKGDGEVWLRWKRKLEKRDHREKVGSTGPEKRGGKPKRKKKKKKKGEGRGTKAVLSKQPRRREARRP